MLSSRWSMSSSEHSPRRRKPARKPARRTESPTKPQAGTTVPPVEGDARFLRRRPTPLRTPRILPRDVRESNLEIIFRGFYEVQSAGVQRPSTHKRHRRTSSAPSSTSIATIGSEHHSAYTVGGPAPPAARQQLAPAAARGGSSVTTSRTGSTRRAAPTMRKMGPSLRLSRRSSTETTRKHRPKMPSWNSVSEFF